LFNKPLNIFKQFNKRIMKKLNLILCIAAFSMMAVSCTKEGTPGATGPAGPAGATGAAGPAGPAGVPGATGTANVIYSDWFNFKLSDYKDTVMFHFKQVALRANKTAPSLTATHLSSGVILSYMAYKPQVSQGWYATLPFINVVKDYSIQINFVPSTGKLTYYWTLDGGADLFADSWGTDSADWFSAELNPADIYFRYVIIPGGAKATSNVANTGLSATQLQALSSKEIEKVLNIPTKGTNINY
jgi:hypothetical protein